MKTELQGGTAGWRGTACCFDPAPLWWERSSWRPSSGGFRLRVFRVLPLLTGTVRPCLFHHLRVLCSFEVLTVWRLPFLLYDLWLILKLGLPVPLQPWLAADSMTWVVPAFPITTRVDHTSMEAERRRYAAIAWPSVVPRMVPAEHELL